ncbi:hypothetical protein HPULCUR_007241 [Helicostylum pulchrum]|uniref:Uncharacterized protein n=1 Tax=Helicostylum pulchrum TaxID=562976 RepID=A0ABP9Y5D9_9FUNG
MKFPLTTLIIGLIIPVIIEAQSSNNTVITYNVVNLLNATESMAVKVDNVDYPMSLNGVNNTQILYSGEAPAAQKAYRYVRVFNNNQTAEPFDRPPVTTNTVNEFFNRTWNIYNVSQLPIVFDPLPAIHRLHTDLHKSGQIPTIHLIGNQTDLDQMHKNSTADLTVVGNISYVNLNQTLFYDGAEISLSGRSSRWFPKLSYNVKLQKKDRLFHNRRIKLRALDTDPSYIREQLAYTIVNNTGLASSEFSYIRVFMNNKELGLFGIIEPFQNPWLANTFNNGDTDYNNGYLYQGVFQTAASAAQNQTSDLSYINNVSAYGLGQYKIKEEAKKGSKVNWQPLMDLTKFIATAPTNTSDAVSQWNQHLDMDSVLRSMALEVLLGYSDGYSTMVDNYYVYQNLQTNKFFWIPSDMDLTLGSTMFNISDMWSGDYKTFPGFEKRPLTTQMLKVPQFQQTYNELLVNLTNALINPAKTNDFINDITGMITEDVAWDKTLPRVGSDIMSSLMSGLDNGNDTSSVLKDIVGEGMPSGIDLATAENFGKRINASISFLTAVNGPTGYISLSGVKEWFTTIHQNVTKFYS